MKMSQYDLHQIARMSFDEDHAAQRVVLTGLDNLVIEPKIDLQALQTKLESLSTQDTSKVEKIEVPTIIKETQFVEVPKIITEFKTIQVPQIIIQEKIVPIEKIIVQEKINKIEVPVVTKQIEYKEIQVPIVIEKVKNENVFNVFQVVQSLALLGILIRMLMK